MAWGRRARANQTKVVNDETIAKAMAKAVCDGDIVNLRLLFLPFSPARVDSPEMFESEKYTYLLPDAEMESTAEFRSALALVRNEATWRHIKRELAANRPAQLPSELLLALGDQALRQGKYTSAAQAYELLRIRQRMQDEFLRQANAALENGDIPKAVRGHIIGAALEYNYAAFPEPLPVVPDYQQRALILHAEYPERPEDSLPLLEPHLFIQKAVLYLLNPGAAAALEPRPLAVRFAFLAELIRRRDPRWDEFAARYREACEIMRDFDQRIRSAIARTNTAARSLADEIDDALGEDPRRIPAKLLGRAIDEGEWWQYLKELAYAHPPAALFVSRQMVGHTEIVVPRYRGDSPIPAELGLLTPALTQSGHSEQGPPPAESGDELP